MVASTAWHQRLQAKQGVGEIMSTREQECCQSTNLAMLAIHQRHCTYPHLYPQKAYSILYIYIYIQYIYIIYIYNII